MRRPCVTRRLSFAAATSAEVHRSDTTEVQSTVLRKMLARSLPRDDDICTLLVCCGRCRVALRFPDLLPHVALRWARHIFHRYLNRCSCRLLRLLFRLFLDRAISLSRIIPGIVLVLFVAI